MSHEYRMEQLRAAIAAARKNFKKDANFFVVGLTYGCRSMCSVIASMACTAGIQVGLPLTSSSAEMSVGDASLREKESFLIFPLSLASASCFACFCASFRNPSGTIFQEFSV